MQELFSQNENISKLSEYLNNPDSGVCLLEGKAGYFKTHCINEALYETSKKEEDDDRLIFNLKCFESTTLDDIFLLFLDTIKNYAKKQKLSFSKIETNDISQRINHYLTHIKAPSVVIIDSLQNVFNNQNEKDREEIIRFILHLASIKSYKVILVSNFFPANFANEFTKRFITSIKINMQPLTPKEIGEYLSNEGHTYTDEDVSNFFELSKGSPAALFVISNIITVLNTSLSKILEEYAIKQQPFGTYLIQKIFTFVPETVKNTLESLSLFNGGLSEAFLIQNEFFTKEQIDYLLDKGLLAKEYGLIYVKSYIKSYLQKTIPVLEKNKFHLKWKEFYTEQLPLKPAQRAVLISRNTMRAQIEYHASQIIKRANKPVQTPNMSLISYLNSDITSWNYQKTNIEKTEKRELPEPPDSIKNKQNQSSELGKYELTEKELALLGLPVDISSKLSKEPLSRTAEQRADTEKENEALQKEESVVAGIEETFSLAMSMENVHNFETAATFYLQALDMTQEEKFEEYQAQILEHLAFCCEKMNRTSDAIDFYNKLIELYSQKGDNEETNQTKLKIAGVYQKTYKLSHAKVIYENFIKQSGSVSNDTTLMSYIGLADIEMSLSNQDKAVEYYEKVFASDTETASDILKNSLSQASYKYAMILDENNEIQKAINYYEKCIELATSNSTAVSFSYTYLADIMKENGDIQKAVEYYQKALDTDIELSNDEGIYYITLRLALIYDTDNPQEAQTWFLKSLSSAKKTKDILSITNAYIELGDFYERTGNHEKSLKSYLQAQKASSAQGEQENTGNIEYKIALAKKQLGSDVYERIVKEIQEDE